jgi:hypothetical protein
LEVGVVAVGVEEDDVDDDEEGVSAEPILALPVGGF